MLNRILYASGAFLVLAATVAEPAARAVHQPILAWRIATVGPVRSSPSIRDGTAYIGGTDGRLYAILISTGTVVWTVDLGSPVVSAPAVSDTRVFVTTRSNDIVAVDRRNGREAWRLRTGTDIQAHAGGDHWDYFSSSPRLAADLLLAGSGNGQLYALDARNGRPRWTFKSDGRIRSAPSVGRDAVVFATVRGSVYAVGLLDGVQRWRFETDGYRIDSAAAGFDRTSVIASPVVVNDMVFIGSRDGRFYALSLAGGRERWRAVYEPSWVVAAAAVAGDTVYVATSDAHSVFAYDAASGKPKWQFDSKVRILSSPLAVGDQIQVGLESGVFVSLDSATGEERWRYATDGRILSSPASAEGTVVVGSDDGYVYAWRDAANEPARAVFWDPARRGRAYTPETSERIAAYFARCGYQPLTAAALTEFLAARTNDQRPSVVVFALDDLPDDVTGDTLSRSVLRRYLEAGGTAVWTGVVPPGYVRRNSEGRPMGIQPDGPEQLTGVPHQLGNGDAYGLTITPAGSQLGLTSWWTARGEARQEDVTTVLATDEFGRSAAWIKKHGVSQQGSLLRLWGSTEPITDAHLREMRAAVERVLARW